MRALYERFMWWWYGTTGRDCTRWIQTLAARGGSAGWPDTILVPRGTYTCGDPKLPVRVVLQGELE